MFCGYVLFCVYQEMTEFNTAHNRRIPAVLDMATVRPKRKRSMSVRFAEEDTVINPGGLLAVCATQSCSYE